MDRERPRFTHWQPLEYDRSVRASIVVTTYNRVHQLLSLLHALAVQTHENTEVLVVHDGPCPHAEQVLAAFPGLMVHYTPEARGLWGYPLRSRYEEMTTGDYVGGLCDDDWVAPTYVEYLLHAATSPTHGADVAYCDYLHNYTSWGEYHAADFRSLHIGIGGWLGRREVVLAHPAPRPYHATSDGERIDRMREAGVTSVRVPRCLMVHG